MYGACAGELAGAGGASVDGLAVPAMLNSLTRH